jgi:hypothetical protein
MGPRSTRQAVIPPSGGDDEDEAEADDDGDADAEASAGADEDAGAEAVVDDAAVADATPSAGPALPGDALHAVRTAKTSHPGARTLLLYYA